MRFFPLHLALLITPASAFAASTTWQAHEAVQARLATKEDTLAIELKLTEGWHTYSQEPGASGIAPQFDFSRSQNIKVGEITYPPARFYDDGIGGYYGYEEGVVFTAPFTHTTRATPATINLVLDIGVCRTLCVPVQFDFSLALP